MSAFKDFRARAWANAAAVMAIATSTGVIAQTPTSTITTVTTTVVGEKLPAIGLVDPNGNSCGRIIITDNRLGSDALDIDLRCLKRHAKYSLVLTQSPTPGSLPAQLVTEFASTFEGSATFTVASEVVEAFGTANQFLADGQGIANISDAGARNNGAVTIPLDWFGVYESLATDALIQSNGGSVFGHNSRVRGGARALTSTTPIPNPALVARLYGPRMVAQFGSKEQADQNQDTTSGAQLLAASSSAGDIARFVLEQLGGPSVEVWNIGRGQYAYRIPLDRNHAGEVLRWRLTAVGRNGASSTTTLSQTIVRSPTEAPLSAQLPPVHLSFLGVDQVVCDCFGNIVSYRWEVLGTGSSNLTETKLSGGSAPYNRLRFANLNFAPGDALPVRVTVTDASGATSTATTRVLALDLAYYFMDSEARFSVIEQ